MVFESKKISALIFDFGGVIINIDFKRTQNAFRELGIENFDVIYSKSTQDGLFDDLETGKITPAQFHSKIRELSGKQLSDNEIDTAWNALVLDIPKERIELLEKLKSKYKLFLLSNTNEIHIEYFSQGIEKQYSLAYFNSLFNKIYFSSRMGMRKPHAEIFEFVLKEQHLDPGRTLFIDDSIQHIEGARKVGLQTFHLDKGLTISDIFNEQTGSLNSV